MSSAWLWCGVLLAQAPVEPPDPATPLALPPAAGERACAWGLDLSMSPGAVAFARTNGQGWSGGAALAVTLGATPCIHLPLRMEAHAGTNSRGPPWGNGVDAVEVSQWNIDFGAAAGIAHEVSSSTSHAFGVEALAGPIVRITRVGIRVYDDTHHSTGARLFAGGTVGGYFVHGGWRLALRAAALLPWQRELSVTVMVGHRL